MKLVKASFKILTPIHRNEILAAIERAGRTCYKSEDSITEESANKFVQMLINRGHESVLEHQSISVLVVCDRGVSHELVRHRIASFSQESTRYCNYSKKQFGKECTFIIPEWLDMNEGHYKYTAMGWQNGCVVLPDLPALNYFMDVLDDAEHAYFDLLEWGWTPQQARSVLPNALKTEIVITANLREWRTIFKQRTSSAAHPQMREIMIPLLKELQSNLPIIFDDILP
jgi:thymidylate synthase (FAD)